jgi:hypothetical protein
VIDETLDLELYIKISQSRCLIPILIAELWAHRLLRTHLQSEYLSGLLAPDSVNCGESHWHALVELTTEFDRDLVPFYGYSLSEFLVALRTCWVLGKLCLEV